MVIAAQREELRQKSQTIKALVAGKLSGRRALGESIHSTRKWSKTSNDPLFAKVTMMVENQLVKK